MGYVRVALAAVLWGTWALYLRGDSLSGASAGLLVFIVMSMPAVLARRPLWRERGAGLAMVVLGIGDALNVLLYFEAMRRGPVAVAVLTHYLAPLLVTLAAPLLLHERLSRRALIATPLSLVGLWLVIRQPGAEFAWTTALLGAGSGVFYASNVLMAKRASRAYAPLEVASLRSPLSVLTLLLVMGPSVIPTSFDGAFWIALIGATVNSFFGSVLFNSGLQKIPASAASAITYLEPLVAAVVGVLFFGEAMGVLAVFGTLLVVVAGAWVVLDRPVAPVPATSTG